MAAILATLRHLHETRGEEVQHWFAAQRAKCPAFFYSSVDLRHSGFRLVPVDTNLFPAGFNNLSPAARQRASQAIARLFKEQYAQVKRVVIIPENHTRNLAYLENLWVLKSLFETLGIDVQLGSLGAQEKLELETASGKTLVQYPVSRDGNKLMLEGGFEPDLIIVNNDMSTGSPERLRDLAQPVLPPVGMGWYRRRKSVHFAAYRTLLTEFCGVFDLDPWLLGAEFHGCGMVDFKERTGLDCVAKAIDEMIAHSKIKYQQYGIEDEPYVFIKADSGTYGMGIMTVREGSEMLELNKKARNKMQTIKEGVRVSDVLIQEGIPTTDTVGEKPAEPMVYLIDGMPVGGMFRVNASRDAYNNLNASGMEFTGMCDEVEDGMGDWQAVRDCHFRSYGTVAAIAALAAAREEY